jgi:GMP synthase (glutamine-hydrolysing)
LASGTRCDEPRRQGDPLRAGLPHRRHLDGAPFALIADDERRYYGTQFHPEVMHTPDGAKLLSNFAHHVCGLKGDWTMAEFRAAKIAEIRRKSATGG